MIQMPFDIRVACRRRQDGDDECLGVPLIDANWTVEQAARWLQVNADPANPQPTAVINSKTIYYTFCDRVVPADTLIRDLRPVLEKELAPMDFYHEEEVGRKFLKCEIEDCDLSDGKSKFGRIFF